MPQDVQDEGNPPTIVRPYRSHKIPACTFCRKRKIRCDLDFPDRACRPCRRRGVQCIQSEPLKAAAGRSWAVPHSRRTRPPAQASPQLSDPSVTAPVEDRQIPGQQRDDATDGERPPQSEHVIGPTLARDVQVLEQYMSPMDHLPESPVRQNSYNVYSDDPRDPVLSMRIPRQRVVLPSGNGTPGFRQFEILEKILEPHTTELFNL